MIGQIKSGQYSKNIARAISKEYCPHHKARGIHDFILATKSSVWIIINNINTNARKIIFKKCHIQHKQLCVYLLLILGLWGHYNPHTNEASSVLFCVSISVTSQAQLATNTSSYSCCI